MIVDQARLRGLCLQCLSAGLHTSACFFADKLVSLAGSLPQDVFLLAQAYFASKQYRRALMVLKRDDMHERDLSFKYLAARCLAECKDWEECLAVLGDGSSTDSCFYDKQAVGRLGHAVSLQASVCLLRARAFEMMENRARAIFWYKQALLKDAYCYEAFNALIEGHMLSAEEELQLVHRLSLHSEDRWMHLLLTAKCKKYNLHNQMEGILQELEAPCSAQTVPPAQQPTAPHCTNSHPTQPHQQQQRQQQQQHRTSASAAAAGPINSTPSTMSTNSRLLQDQTSGDATLQEPPSAPPPLHPRSIFPGQAHAQPPTTLTPTTAAAAGKNADADEGMLLARVPATPTGSEPSTRSMRSAHAPTPEGPAVARAADTWGTPPSTSGPSASGWAGGAAAHGLEGSGRGGLLVPCEQSNHWSTPVASAGSYEGGGGSDMEADTPGAQLPTPLGLGACGPGRAEGQQQAGSAAAAAAAAAERSTGFPGSMDVSTPIQHMGGGGQRLAAGALDAQEQHGVQSLRQQQGQGQGVACGGGCGLRGNVDVAACRADWLYHRRAYEACIALTSRILDSDPYALQCLPTHSAACVALGRKAELFMRGHQLVEEYPDRAVAWFTVGCYYMCTKQYEQARRYFGKATSLEPSCAPAWIAFGHAFSAQDERDQAMTAYRRASRLFPGLHLALLGMGMEYSQMGNLQLAERMLLSTHQLCPTDPATCHELGVLNYRNGQHAVATTWLLAALALVPPEPGQPQLQQQPQQPITVSSAVTQVTRVGSRLSSAWEPTVLALGHCMRKQLRWAEAQQLYAHALALCPGQPGTFAALGYTHQLRGQLSEAIEAYHAALAIRPDDSFTVDMLNKALEEYAKTDF